jgi:two-component SAPR family response regulator
VAILVNLAGLSVLILHDEVPASLELNAVVSNFGCRRISTFYYTSIARLWLDRFTPHLAILEISIDDEGCFELMAFLIEKRVPLVVCSADGRWPQSAGSALCGVEWIAKDAAPHTIQAAIQSAFSTVGAVHANPIVVSQAGVAGGEGTAVNG